MTTEDDQPPCGEMTSGGRARRSFLAFCATVWAGIGKVHAQTGMGKQIELVNLLNFATPGVSDWTAALNQATAIARRVYIPAGEYLLRGADWPADTELFGDGDATVLRVPADANYLITNDSGSHLEQGNIVNLFMHDLQLRGTCDVDGFSEFRHLVSLNGVTGARFSRVLFKGFRGDGLYVGSGNSGRTERHNRDVSLDTCRFDGINRQNRNGITVIDCDGFRVEDCTFENMTSARMPGAIDIEPNPNPYHLVRNIGILRNRFNNIGGNVGVIAVYVPAVVVATPANITVELNMSDNYAGTGAFFMFNDNRLPYAGSPENNIRVAGNYARQGVRPFLILGGKRVILEANTFTDFSRPGFVGFSGNSGATSSVRDLRFFRNTLTRCGFRESSAVTVFNVDGARFVGNRFIDPANGNPVTSSAIRFARGKSSGIIFSDNEFLSHPGKSLAAIRTEPEHVFTPATNRFARNRLHGQENHFPVIAR